MFIRHLARVRLSTNEHRVFALLLAGSLIGANDAVLHFWKNVFIVIPTALTLTASRCAHALCCRQVPLWPFRSFAVKCNRTRAYAGRKNAGKHVLSAGHESGAVKTDAVINIRLHFACHASVGWFGGKCVFDGGVFILFYCRLVLFWHIINLLCQ